MRFPYVLDIPCLVVCTGSVSVAMSLSPRFAVTHSITRDFERSSVKVELVKDSVGTRLPSFLAFGQPDFFSFFLLFCFLPLPLFPLYWWTILVSFVLVLLLGSVHVEGLD